MAKPTEVLNPVATLRELHQADPSTWSAYADRLKAMTVDELRAENARLWACVLAQREVQGKLWMVNVRFTTLGIAPRWRDAPKHLRQDGPESIDIQIPGASQPLTETARRRYFVRWVDLYWLRHELGPGHPIDNPRWVYAFSAPDFERIFPIVVRDPTGDRTGTSDKPNRLILDELNVPPLWHYALNGFQTQAVRDRRKNLERWLDGPVSGVINGQTTRLHHALTDDQVVARLRDVWAIELAAGSPTDAALVRRWMTGEAVSRVAMLKRRNTLARQVPPLRRRRSWQSVKGD